VLLVILQAHPPVLSGVGEIQGTFDGSGFQFGSLQGNVKFHAAGTPLGIEGPSMAVALPHSHAETAAQRRLVEVRSPL
jgi:hypothetical protein